MVFMANVIVYSTPTCPWCVRARQFLDQNNVKYTYYDVSEDQDKLSEMVAKSGQMGVPVIDIDGKIIVGFNEPKIRELLGL